MAPATGDILSMPANDAADFLADPVGHLSRVYRRHGREVSNLSGRDDIVFAFGPEHNKAILTHPDRFLATGFLFPGPKNSAQRRLLSGIFNLNGERHRDQRRVIRGTFQKSMLPSYSPCMTTICEDFFRDWRPGETRDISAEMLNLVAKINGRLVLGLEDEDLVGQLESATEEWTSLNAPLLLAGALKQDLEPGWYERALGCAERLEQLATRALAVRRDSAVQGDDLITGLFRAHDADPERISRVELVGQVAHLFAASNQTTRSALTWTLLLLAQSPDVLRNLQREFRGALDGGPFDVRRLPQMPLFERVVKESLRLFPPVAYYTRMTAEPLDLGGRMLRKGTTVVFSHYVTHHMPDIYDSPETFAPDRWLTIDPSPYEYLPYGVGPRMCIGASYASQAINVALPALLQHFSVAVAPGTRIDRRISTVLTPRNGIPMKLLRPGAPTFVGHLEGNINEMVVWPRIAAAA